MAKSQKRYSSRGMFLTHCFESIYYHQRLYSFFRPFVSNDLRNDRPEKITVFIFLFCLSLEIIIKRVFHFAKIFGASN